jgi:hypothetical protein
MQKIIINKKRKKKKKKCIYLLHWLTSKEFKKGDDVDQLERV